MSSFSEREAIDAILHDFRRELHTSFPAKVLAYNAAAGTVDVRPAIVRELQNGDPDASLEYEELPDIFAVPVMWPRCGSFAITLPLAPGDWVGIHCAEQALHVWRTRGVAPSKPGVSDEFGLNGCVATLGWYPDREKLANVSTTDLEIRSVDGAVKIVVDGSTVHLGSNVSSQFVALANLVDARLSAIQATFDAHTHPAPGGTTSPTSTPIGSLASTAATKAKGV